MGFEKFRNKEEELEPFDIDSTDIKHLEAHKERFQKLAYDSGLRGSYDDKRDYEELVEQIESRITKLKAEEAA